MVKRQKSRQGDASISTILFKLVEAYTSASIGHAVVLCMPLLPASEPHRALHIHVMRQPLPNRSSCALYLTIPSKRFLYHLTVSAWWMRCDAPILVWHRRRLATRSPGRVLSKVLASNHTLLRPRVSYLLHAAVKVHAVNTNRWIVLDTQINVFRDTEAEVASLAEVPLPELVLLDFQPTLENLLCFGSSDCDVHGDLLVTADTEGSDGVAGFACSASIVSNHSSGSHAGYRSRGLQHCSLIALGRNVLYTGVCPLNCSSTFAARVSLSPDSPTEMLRTSFWIRSSFIGFEDLSAAPWVLTFWPSACCVELSPLACNIPSVRSH